jgi:hypothetical protein
MGEGTGGSRKMARRPDRWNSPSCELVTGSILDVDNIEGAAVLLLVDDGTHTALIVASGDHDQLADIELDEVLDLASLQVEHHGVVHLPQHHKISGPHVPHLKTLFVAV